ncbi:hypothetical protein BHE90_016138 [Fusarium euwallaceae]|uniref:Uncharacterized protein n=1 Tax=Fusarium euwallaceae TaxID=1147111 RepID=A0A430L1A8_9HYPO|nr:hypothetical protein BHE90_016138 [Fusarium euwallaceae]
MAPSPAGGDQSGQGNSDACDARQQLDPPSKRRRLEELGESYRHKRQKIQEQQNDMPTLGYSTNHDYRGPGDEPEQPARLDAYSPQDSESGTDNTSPGGDKYRQSKAKSGIRPPQPRKVIRIILRRSQRLDPSAATTPHGVLTPASTLETRENNTQGGAMPAVLKRKHQPQRRGSTRERLRTRGRDTSEATATPEVEDSDQSQGPEDEPESQALSVAESESQAHHQPEESPSARSSPTASSGFPNAIQQQPITLNTDQPGDGEDSEDDRDFGPGGDYECADYDDGGDYGGDNISLGGDRQSALYRETGHIRHWDQHRAESTNDMPFVARPSQTLRMRGDIARDRARPASSTMAIQPEQPEDSEDSGTDDTSLAGDEYRQLLPSASGSNISYRQARSQDHAKRQKLQEAEHDIHGEMPSEEPSSAHSSPTAASGFPNAIQQQPITLNTDYPGDSGEGNLIFGETETMAPGLRGGNESDQDDDGAHQKTFAEIEVMVQEAEMELEEEIRVRKGQQQKLEGQQQKLEGQHQKLEGDLQKLEGKLEKFRRWIEEGKRELEKKEKELQDKRRETMSAMEKVAKLWTKLE